MKNSIRNSASISSLAVTALILVGAFATAASARAAEPNLKQRIAVNYADLNTDSQQGAKVLYARIRQAARTICSPLAGPGPDLPSHHRWQGCFDDAISSAVAQVNMPLVTALHKAVQNVKG